MNNPLLKSVLVSFPDVDAASLPWPDGAEAWTVQELELFIGSGGFLKPKKKKAAAKAVPKAPSAPAPAARPAQEGSRVPQELPSNFDSPGYSAERRAITMPVHVHCEDTAPGGHVRLESLTAFCERIRSLALKQLMGVSLADLKERNLAILATEYVTEIVGTGVRHLETLRIDTWPEFPAAPLFPWEAHVFNQDGTEYMHGRYGLNLCAISSSGAYSGVDEAQYNEFVKDMRDYANPEKAAFSATNLRFYGAYDKSGIAFKPSAHSVAMYFVRSSDCDMYNVLFQARVPAMMECCHQRHDTTGFYVNIRTSVRPGDELQVHVFSTGSAALFVCVRQGTAVLTAVGHYGSLQPFTQEELRCASLRVPLLLKFCNGGPAPSANEDFDLSRI